MPGFRFTGRRAAPGFLLAGMLLAACSTSVDPVTEGQAGWRKLTQIEKRFAIFMNDPPAAPLADLATFRFVYVYAPGTMLHEGREVSWQEYSAMAVDCAENKVRVGPRARYAPDGGVISADDNQEFADIIGPAIVSAADVACRGITAPAQTVLPDGPGWLDAARANIAASNPF